MFIKKIIISLTLVMLFGCSSGPNTEETKEQILIKTNNYSDLIIFYKNQLKEEEDPYTREKLAQAYLDSGDPDSALFAIQYLDEDDDSRSMTSFLIEANAQLECGMLEPALETVNRVYKLNENNPEIENLLGVIYASKRDLDKSRHYFNLARKHLYSDITIKNNLAILNIIEGNYEQAVKLLLPIYMSNKNDALVQANLMLAMAKADDLEFMEKVLSPQFSKQEIERRYSVLKNTESHRDDTNLFGVKRNNEN
ncbi:tetratricopeptide repeat protein [Aliivibrio fischeri]|uniref:tetratricopeptide repeat protein n=1 Tax=Aliivibrio fischeri TaxID=668 RepID=UPI003735CAB8